MSRNEKLNILLGHSRTGKSFPSMKAFLEEMAQKRSQSLKESPDFFDKDIFDCIELDEDGEWQYTEAYNEHLSTKQEDIIPDPAVELYEPMDFQSSY